MSDLELKKQIESLAQKTDRILYYIDNDPHTGRKGLYQEMADLRVDVNSILDRDKIIRAKIGAFGMMGGILAFVISKLIAVLIAIIK